MCRPAAKYASPNMSVIEAVALKMENAMKALRRRQLEGRGRRVPDLVQGRIFGSSSQERRAPDGSLQAEA